MSFTALSPNWQMTALFFLFLLPLCFVMKLIAFRGTAESRNVWTIISWFPTPASVRQALPLSAAPRLIRRFTMFFGGCGCAYWLYWQLLRIVPLPPILSSYLGSFILWLVTEALGSLAPFVALPSGKLLPLPHGPTPPFANGISEFWGRRWNLWLSEWFRQVVFRPLRNHPVLALFLAFLASGILHELVINVPLYIVTSRKCFGSMIAYFLLQAVGILVERKTRHHGVRILLVWLFVFGAVPLMVNEGMLRVLHLWPA